MTHAESQDLLLDLACGELDAQRAAEVEQHLATCSECREEKAALEEARRLAAPLRELEEPPPGFDDRILLAARAEAHHQHDGNVGQVIEVAGNVGPLGVDAARIDAHGPVKARPAERRRPKWMLRAALGGSVATAAALALVVSTTLDARRTAQRASQAQGEDYRIRVKPAAPEVVDSALRDAEANRDRDRAAAAKEQGPAAPAPAEPPRVSFLEKKQEPSVPPPARKRRSGVRVEDSGEDAAESLAAPRTGAGPPSAGAPARAPVQSGERTSASRAAPPSAGVPAMAPVSSGEKVAASKVAPPSSDAVSAPEKEAGRVAPAAIARADVPGAPPAQPEETQANRVKGESRKTAAAPEAAPEATGIEANAQQARHAGNYLLAASLYRSAAHLRDRDGDAASAAWNLAHAVECLSAVARFEEARQVRDELARLYPAQTTALSAARRALREVDAPESLPASKQK